MHQLLDDYGFFFCLYLSSRVHDVYDLLLFFLVHILLEPAGYEFGRWLVRWISRS